MIMSRSRCRVIKLSCLWAALFSSVFTMHTCQVRTHLTMPVKELAPLPNPLSPKHLFTPPPVSPSSLTTPRQMTYSDMFKAKKASSQKPLPLTQSLATVQPPTTTGGPWTNGGVLSSTNERAQPLFTSRHASVGEDQSRTVPPNASMSVTWPRSGGGVSQMKLTNQISADTSKLTGGKSCRHLL